jgi:hypothetical protein
MSIADRVGIARPRDRGRIVRHHRHEYDLARGDVIDRHAEARLDLCTDVHHVEGRERLRREGALCVRVLEELLRLVIIFFAHVFSLEPDARPA